MVVWCLPMISTRVLSVLARLSTAAAFLLVNSATAAPPQQSDGAVRDSLRAIGFALFLFQSFMVYALQNPYSY